MNFARELFSRNQTPMTSCQQRQAEERRQLQQLTPRQPDVIDLTEEGIQYEISLYQERMAYLQLLSVIRAILRDTFFTALPQGTTLYMIRDVINAEIQQQEEDQQKDQRPPSPRQ